LARNHSKSRNNKIKLQSTSRVELRYQKWARERIRILMKIALYNESGSKNKAMISILLKNPSYNSKKRKK